MVAVRTRGLVAYEWRGAWVEPEALFYFLIIAHG